MDSQVNQDFLVSAYFSDSTGPLTGLAAGFVCTVTNRATGATLATPTVTESPASSGYYVATIDNGVLTSRLRIRVTFVNSAAELYSEAFYSVGVIPSWARTRRELRRRIASRLAGTDDRIWQERAASGSTTTAVLSNLTVGGEHEYRGGWLWFGNGANEGAERRVTAFASSTSTLTFGPALGTAVTAGDRVELYPSSLRPSRLNDAIDDAVSDLSGFCLLETDETALATDGTTTEWELPSDLRYVYRVGLVRDSDSQLLGWYSADAWTLLPNRRLRLDRGVSGDVADPLDWGATGGLTALPDGYTLRVLGLADVAPPLYDDSSVDIVPEAVVGLAAYRLALTLPALREVLPLWRQDADAARARASTRLPSGVREVPR